MSNCIKKTIFHIQLKRGSDLVECKAGEISSVSLEDKVNILDFLEERKDLDFTDQLWKVSCGHQTVTATAVILIYYLSVCHLCKQVYT